MQVISSKYVKEKRYLTLPRVGNNKVDYLSECVETWFGTAISDSLRPPALPKIEAFLTQLNTHDLEMIVVTDQRDYARILSNAVIVANTPSSR